METHPGEVERWRDERGVVCGGVTGEAGGQRYPDDHDDHGGAESSGAEPMEGWQVGGAASRRDES